MAVSQSLSVTQSSQSVANNTSQVRIRWTSTQSGDSWNGNTRTAYYYISINGGSETRYSVSYTLPMGTTKTIVDKTITVNHKADGTGKITVRTWMDTDISAGVIEKSQSLTLTTIPRATTPTMSNPTMGNTVTISLPRASSSFTHTLTYKFGSASGTIATGAGSSASWTVPLNLADQVPSATSGTGTVTCKTYSGGSLVGTKTINFTAYVPSSVVPSITSVSISEATSGLASKFHAYVQGKSTLSVTVSASGAHSSTIKSYSTTVLGVKYTSRTFTSGVLNAPGSVTISTTVTDSRGRTASNTKTITVQPYTAPKINGLNVYRINSSGEVYDDGTLIAAAMNYEIAQVGGYNDHTYTLEYKLSNQPDSSYVAFNSGSAGWTYNNTVKFLSGPTFLTNNSYKIRLKVADYFTSDSRVFDLPSAFTIMDFRNTGKGMAIGKVSEKDALEIAMPVEIEGCPVPPPWKTLWSGTWNMGDDPITVPGTEKYHMFMISGSSQGTLIPCFKWGAETVYVRGLGGYARASEHDTHAFSATISGGNKWTMVNATSYMRHAASGNHNAISTFAVTSIIGIL